MMKVLRTVSAYGIGAFIAVGITGVHGCKPPRTTIPEHRGAPTLPVETTTTTTTTLPPTPVVISPPAEPAEREIRPPKYAQPPILRVWLSGMSTTPEIGAGACRVQAGNITKRLTKLGPSRVKSVFGGFDIAGEVYKGTRIDIIPDGRGTVKVDGHAFSGTIRLTRSDAGITVINLIDLERYLLGVLGSEMPASWHRNALRAQAVAARTYALYYHLQRANFDWDLTNSVEDQVYSGGAPHAGVRDAVQATTGQVLLHKGCLFPTFFHSTCGGGTQLPGRALGKAQFDFIGQAPCDYCRASKYFSWSERIAEATLAARLNASDMPVRGKVTAIAVIDGEGDGSGANAAQATPTGLVVRVSASGGDLIAPIVEFRRAIGRSAIKSGNFQCRQEPDAFVFTGHGLGHGAGMCQYGARGMAQQGQTYRQILAFYYQNTLVEKLY